MIVPTALDPARAAQYRAAGWWVDLTFDEILASTVERLGDAPFIVDGDTTLSFREAEAAAGRVAGALADRGVSRGDVVAWQLPNWWESAVVHIAICRLAAVSCPLHMIYRQSELRLVLAESRPRLFLVAGRHHSVSYLTNAREACADLEDPPEVIGVRGEEDGFSHLLGGVPVAAGAAEPDDVSILMYTSGTTAMPKGVMHTHNTMRRCAWELGDQFAGTGPADRLFVPSPVTHVTGLLWGVHIPVLTGTAAVYMERWDASKALDLILEQRCTFVGGATAFIHGVIEQVRRRGLQPHEIPLERGTSGGADVPPTLIADAEAVLGARFSRCYGMSENPLVSVAAFSDRIDRRGETDGRIVPTTEFKVVDEVGDEVPVGESGQAVFRGPASFVGYLDARRNVEGLDSSGWIQSGDRLELDAEGYVTCRGRIKDLIIRGGENLGVKEIEDLLVQHPAVETVAVVAMPDPLLGERACAFIVPAGEDRPPLSEFVRFLRDAQIAPQKAPERVEWMPEGLPMTSSGKIQKYRLRHVIAEKLRDEAREVEPARQPS